MKLINEMKLSVLSLFFLLSMSSCMVVTIPESPEKTIMGHENICNGDLYGAGEEGLEVQQIIIESQEELESLLDKMSSINPTSCSDILMTVDFNQYDLIFLLDRVRGSGGHSIQVTEVIKLDNLVSVEYKYQAPTGMATTVLTQPFQFVQVLKLNSEVSFVISE